MTRLNVVHLRINDAATGRPTPARVRITDDAGTTYFPLGWSPQFSTARGEDVGGQVAVQGEHWAYIPGHCEMTLPAGRLRVQVAKGPEFTPLDEWTHLPAGKLALRFTISRCANLAAEGWHAADARVHHLPPHAALLEGQAEGLAFVHLLALGMSRLGSDGETYLPHPNLLAFSGQQPLLAAEGCTVAVNTLNRHPLLGSLGLLHSHRPVHPLEFGGVYGPDDWSLADWCEQCHRKGGLVTWANAFRAGEPFAGEGLANLLLGQIDALEVEPTALGGALFARWYSLLNLGVRVPLIGASGKDSNAILLGAVRAYAIIDGEPALPAWVSSVKAGRTFITNGPLLRFALSSHRPGDPLDGRLTIDVRASQPGRLDLLHNGKPLATVTGDQPLTYSGEPQPGWYAVRFLGAATGRQHAPFAHTSPIYHGVVHDAAAANWCRDQLERGLAWVETEARCDEPRSRERLRGTFRAALERLPSPN